MQYKCATQVKLPLPQMRGNKKKIVACFSGIMELPHLLAFHFQCYVLLKL